MFSRTLASRVLPPEAPIPLSNEASGKNPFPTPASSTERCTSIPPGDSLSPCIWTVLSPRVIAAATLSASRSVGSFTITKQIKEIVAQNKDIKVWNISLGSNQEINDNFISAEAALLDQIQYENDIIFVIAGTNKPSDAVVKIGSPADSINSMVVNAVTKNGLSTKYSRKGLALSFFAKPDISYYGGSGEQYIQVCEPLGVANVAGTSFAAPWIARKLSYLIDILGLNREVAKAIIIDAARSWNEKSSTSW